MKIYKFTSYGDADFPHVKYGTSKLVFEKQKYCLYIHSEPIFINFMFC